jgi:hypothetical protein
MTETEVLVWQIVGWVIVIGIGPAIFLVVRAIVRTPEQKFRRIYAGIPIDSMAAPNTVFIKFHTYDGFLVWFTQTTHTGYIRADLAPELLRRLHRYNLTYGLFSAGALFIPMLSYLNYRAQLKAVIAQKAGITSGDVQSEVMAEMKNTFELAFVPSSPLIAPQKSWFRMAVGGVAAALCLVFAVTTIVWIIQGNYELGVGGIFASLFLGNVAREWLPGIPSE